MHCDNKLCFVLLLIFDLSGMLHVYTANCVYTINCLQIITKCNLLGKGKPRSWDQHLCLLYHVDLFISFRFKWNYLLQNIVLSRRAPDRVSQYHVLFSPVDMSHEQWKWWLWERVRGLGWLGQNILQFFHQRIIVLFVSNRDHDLSYDPGVFLNSLSDLSSVIISVYPVTLHHAQSKLSLSHIHFISRKAEEIKSFCIPLTKIIEWTFWNPWLISQLPSSQVSLSTASDPSLDDDDEEGRQIFTSGGTAFLALNQTFALLAAALLGASLLGLLFLLGTNPGAGADQGGYGGGGSGYGSGYGGGSSGYGSHKTRREANWGKCHSFRGTGFCFT